MSENKLALMAVIKLLIFRGLIVANLGVYLIYIRNNLQTNCYGCVSSLVKIVDCKSINL